MAVNVASLIAATRYQGCLAISPNILVGKIQTALEQLGLTQLGEAL